MKRQCFCILLMLFAWSVLSPAREVSLAKLAGGLRSVLDRARSEESIRVIVTLRDSNDISGFPRARAYRHRSALIRSLRENAERADRPLRAFLEHRGVHRIKSLWHINALAFEAGPGVIRELARRPDVVEIRIDEVIRLEPHSRTSAEVRNLSAAHLAGPLSLLEGTSQGYLEDSNGVQQAPPEWHLDMVNAPEVWARGWLGQGVVVATMDTGVDINHPDLQGSWRGGDNSWLDTDHVYDGPHDSDGHGTSVMGIIAGGSAGGTAIGVAPQVQWIAARIFDDVGNSSYSRAHEGFAWLLDPDGDPNTDDAPDIVNNSWEIRNHVNECVLEFYEDIRLLRQAGIAVVFAAGNSGPSIYTSVSPANYDNVVSVGSVDSDSVISLLSSRGPGACGGVSVFPLMTAPGQGIHTTDLTYGGRIPLSYSQVSGTSFAAPVVSGAMALLLSGHPGLETEAVENLLALSAVDKWEPGPDRNYGYGMIDVEAAAALAETVLRADLDVDDDVDLGDLGILASYWLRSDCSQSPPCAGDLDDSGTVDLLDYTDFASLYRLLERP